jgi:hypothetical protein
MQILPNGKCQFIDQNGAPLANGSVFFYAPGTTNPLPTYQDSAGTTPNTNPIQLDSRGQAIIWGSATYRQIVKDANGVTVWDQIVSAAASADALNTLTATLSSSSGSSTIGFVGAAPGSTVRTVQDKLRESVSVADFGAVGDGSDETAKLTAAITYAAQNGIPLNWPAGKVYSVTNISVLLGGGVFEWTGRPRIKQLSTGNPANPVVQLGGTVLATVSLSQSSMSQSQSVTLSDASSVQPGYLLRLATNRLAYGDHRFDPQNCFGQLCKVASVSGNTAQLVDNLVFDLAVTTITTGTAQGGTTGSITLSAGDASTANQLKNYLLTITGGTGAGQSKYINTYNPTTKVADIGTAYTGVPQTPWAITPDSTSQYSVSATVSAQVIQPAYVKSLANLELVGYRAPMVKNYGLMIEFCDSPLIDGVRISDCSVTALESWRNYCPKMVNCDISGANVADTGNLTFGFGQVSYGDYKPLVDNCTFENCSQACDANNATMFLTRTNNTITGGGLAYDGVTQLWPGNVNIQTCGLATHSSTFGVTDSGNTITDVYFNKQRGMWQTTQGNTYRGRMYYCNQISYCTGASYIGNLYDDGMTNEPSSGVNGDINGDDGFPLTSKPDNNRPRAFLNIRHNTMVSYASTFVKGNVIKSVSEGVVFFTDQVDPPATDWPSNQILTVTDNDVSVIQGDLGLGFTNLGVVKYNGSGTPALANFTAFNNIVHVGGAGLGTVKADNMGFFPFVDDMAVTTPLVYQFGPSKWLCILQDQTVTQVPFPQGQGVFRLTVFEKDAVVGNYFSGILQRGNATPIATFASSGVSIRTDTPLGSIGTAGNLNVFARTDSLYINNRTGTPGKFVFMIEGAF